MSRQGIKKQEKKDPGIPNLCPQKKELLEELQAQKKLEHEYNLEVRKRQKEQKTTQEFQELRNPEPVYKQNNSLEALITSSDIIFEVLDSRDPYPSPHLKLLIGTKPHVFIINKADLIDSTQLDLWKEKFSNESLCFVHQLHPTETMKNELQSYINSLSSCIIGITGYPNVGKSSVVNALKGYKIASITKLPGCTKKIEEYEINDKLKVLDSPGITMKENKPVDVLRTTVDIENLKDPYTPVQGILEIVNKEKLLMLYAIPDFKNIKEFLASVAKKSGKVATGGMPDFDFAAKIVLHDWFTAKIPYSASYLT